MDDSSPIPLKRCAKCNEMFPATTEYFRRRPDRKSGLRSRCRDCYNECLRERYALEHPKDVPDGYRRCSTCNEVKPATGEFFSIRKSGQFHSPCKACAAAYNKQHAKHISERGCKYYQEHREETRIRGQAYRQQHKEQVSQRNRRHYQANRSYYITKGANRRVLRKNIGGKYTAQQIQEQLKRQQYRCYYAACGQAKFEKKDGKYIFHIDHTFPLSRVVGTEIPANDIGYLVLACPSCNESKKDKFPWEWPEGGRLL